MGSPWCKAQSFRFSDHFKPEGIQLGKQCLSLLPQRDRLHLDLFCFMFLTLSHDYNAKNLHTITIIFSFQILVSLFSNYPQQKCPHHKEHSKKGKDL